MSKPTKLVLEKRINQVIELLNQGKNALYISEVMNIPYSTVQRYVKIATVRQKEKWDEISNESLEDRALLIKQKYEDVSQVCEELLHDKSKTPAARIEAGKTMVACQLNIYNMLKDGPFRFQKIETKEIRND